MGFVLQEPRKSPISLESLCGTYSWVFENDDDGLPGEVREHNSGYFKLNFPPGKEVLLANMTGSVIMWTHKGDFYGLKEVKEGDQIKNNYWEIVSLDWDMEEEGQIFGATEVIDDEGHPFLEFQGHWGCFGCVPHGGKYLLKKQEEVDVMEYLSNSEKRRLGINRNNEEVETLAKQAGGKKAKRARMPKSEGSGREKRQKV